MKLFVRVKTGAREERVEAIDAGHFKVSVKALPVDGKANRAVAKALADFLGIAPSELELVGGATSRDKVFDRVS